MDSEIGHYGGRSYGAVDAPAARVMDVVGGTVRNLRASEEEFTPEEAELALRLARALKGARATSRFAITTFLAAVEEDGVIGAELRVTYDHREQHLECESRIRAPE